MKRLKKERQQDTSLLQRVLQRRKRHLVSFLLQLNHQKTSIPAPDLVGTISTLLRHGIPAIGNILRQHDARSHDPSATLCRHAAVHRVDRTPRSHPPQASRSCMLHRGGPTASCPRGTRSAHKKKSQVLVSFLFGICQSVVLVTSTSLIPVQGRPRPYWGGAGSACTHASLFCFIATQHRAVRWHRISSYTPDAAGGAND